MESQLLVSVVHNSCFNNAFDVDGLGCDSYFMVYDSKSLRKAIYSNAIEENSQVMCCFRGVCMFGLYLF